MNSLASTDLRPGEKRFRLSPKALGTIGSTAFLCFLAGCRPSSPTVEPGSSGATASSESREIAGIDSATRAAVASPRAVAADSSDRLAGAVFTPVKRPVAQKPSPFRFDEIANKAGIDFRHFSGMTAEKHFPTANGSGAAMFDADGDGKMDLYFATCTLLPLGSAVKGPNKLYRNLGDGRFEDVTEKSGLGFRGFCHGIVAADFDNDGDQDVFLCNYGPNVLYLNDGRGTFRDVSKEAGIDAPNWSSGGAPIDFDNDGDLDLYVSNYGEWIYPKDDEPCEVSGNGKKVRLYCSPRSIRTVEHILYKNNFKETGRVSFENATLKAGVGRPPEGRGHGFGVIAADLNGDGKIDLYVANDLTPNFLFLNKGDGTFVDCTETSAAAYDGNGTAQSSMGTDAEDVNEDGLIDMIVTNFQNEYDTFYLNVGGGKSKETGEPQVFFSDQTTSFNLANDTKPPVGWGCSFGDFDNDGRPDFFVTNGHVDDNRREIGQPVDYAEPPLLFLNEGGRKFRLATRGAGPYIESPHVGRGAAFGDLDDDGRLDIVVNHKDDAPAVLLNKTPRGDNHWIRLKLVGVQSNRDAIGAKVEFEINGRVLHRQVKGGCSMASTNDNRLLVGLGNLKDEVPRLSIRWPSGGETVLEHLKLDRSYLVVEGKGIESK